ncbi:MAG: DUF4012 domain-containing protein [bacterium]
MSKNIYLCYNIGMVLKKNNHLKINFGANSSRFVVDLKLKEESKRETSENFSAKIESRIEKLVEIDYGKKINFALEQLKKAGMAIKAIKIKSASRLKKAKIQAGSRCENAIDRIIFIEFARLLFLILKKIFNLSGKICFAAGYAIVFVLRLAYLLILKTAEKIKNKIFSFAKKDLLPSPDIGYLKPALIFAGALLVIVLPVKAWTYYKAAYAIKGNVLGASENAVNDLISAGQSVADFDFGKAGRKFETAGDNFLKARNGLEEINGFILALASIIPDKNIRLAAESENILKAGELSSAAGKNLSLAIESIFGYKEKNIDSILKNLSFYGHNAINNLAELEKILYKIKSDSIPGNYGEKFILLKQKTSEISEGLKEFIGLSDNLGEFLGAAADKRYLLVFQNNSELRASGGFIGSFALIDFSKGMIKNIEVPCGGSYDTEAGFLKKIKSPEPLSLVSADWNFWDANWWPDWPTSARKLSWFYENSDGSTVDGVIGFTPTVIERLLEITGPIGMKEYGLTIDSENFWFETQKLAEQKPDITKQPKKIIGDLMNKIIEELPLKLNKENFAPLLKILEQSLSDKNILFYFTDEELQKKMDDFGWSGRIKDAHGDYLSVINTNIAGGKSDRKIKQNIIHKTKIQDDGSIIDDLTIERSHEAVNREPFSGVRNVDWMRIYVPLGSELIEATGFKPVDKIFFKDKIDGLADDPEVFASESAATSDKSSGSKIYSEFGKTVFANWSQLDPGQTVKINIKYKLPFKITDEKQKNLYSYSMLAQKQPGMNSSSISNELEISGGFKPIWEYPDNLSKQENFNSDKITAIIYEK